MYRVWLKRGRKEENGCAIRMGGKHKKGYPTSYYEVLSKKEHDR